MANTYTLAGLVSGISGACCLLPGQAQARHVVVALAVILLGVGLGSRGSVQADATQIHKGLDLWRRFDGITQCLGRVDARIPNVLLEAGRPASCRIQHILTGGIHHGTNTAGYALLLQLMPGDAFWSGHPRNDGDLIALLGQVLGQMPANETGAATCWPKPLLSLV